MTSDPPPGVPSARRTRVREAAVQEIKAVARIHLTRSGPADLSLRAVARDVGVAPSALYRYFDSRADLVAALCADSLNAASDAMEAAMPPAQAPAAERVRAAFLALREWARAFPAEFDLVVANRDKETRPDLTTSKELERMVGIPLVASLAGIEDGTIPAGPTSPRLSAPALEILSAWGVGKDGTTLARGITLCAQCLGWLYVEHFGLIGSTDAPEDAYAAYLDSVLGTAR